MYSNYCACIKNVLVFIIPHDDAVRHRLSLKNINKFDNQSERSIDNRPLVGFY